MSAVYLKITSWAGISIGAIHFYGELRARNPYRCVELSNTLTVASAKRLNRHRRDDFRGEDWNYRAGMKVNGFDTEQEIIDLAIKTYKTHFPEGTVLILGDPVYAEPQKIIDGPKSAIKKGIGACPILFAMSGTNFWKAPNDFPVVNATQTTRL